MDLLAGRQIAQHGGPGEIAGRAEQRAAVAAYGVAERLARRGLDVHARQAVGTGPHGGRVGGDLAGLDAPERVRPAGAGEGGTASAGAAISAEDRAREPPMRDRRVCGIDAIGTSPEAGEDGSDQRAVVHRPGRVAHANRG